MKKIRFLTVLSILLINGILNAQQQVSINEARNAAINTLYNKADVLNILFNTEIDTVHSLSNSRSNVLMYEVIFKNRATVLLSGSKACAPILSYYIKPEYDNEAVFDTTNANVPCCLQEFLNVYMQEIEWCFTQNNNVRLSYQSQWEELQQSYLTKGGPPASIIVDLLLSTRWNQSRASNNACDAYNYYVTETYSSCGCTSKRCPVGCVAVAMGQIMKYWNHPVYLPSQSYQYDWCNMPNKLNQWLEPGHPSNPFPYWIENLNYETERNAVARLLKDCADKADMTFCRKNSCASGAYDSDARKALVNNFGYHKDADLQRKNWYTNATWIQRIKENLNQGRPVYYSGSGSGGHAFVCDGYGSDDYFHFNWGWGGSYDGWFTVDDISFEDINDEIHNYTKRQHAIFYIHPDGNSDYCNLTFPLFLHYALGGTHQNVPKTFMRIESAPETSPAAWRTIQSGQSAEYVAHESIRLLPGFKAEAGSHFVARIDPCIGCNSAKVTVKRSDNGVEIEEELYIAVGDNEEKQSSLDVENKIGTGEPQVYPNPTTGLLTIKAKSNNSRIQMIELYNTQGSKLFTFSGNDGYFQEIDISHLPSQVYILKIQMSEQVFTKKLILQR